MSALGGFTADGSIYTFSKEQMISHLMVQNLALVDQIALDFGPGLNVLTGETGAGKSVLVNALSLILGARAPSDIVRTGASEAVVEALFEGLEPSVIGRLAALGLNAPDGQLVVRRTISKAGRSRVQLNGQLATVGMLAKLMHGVLDITSQHEHVGLLEPEAHLDALDAFGELESLRSTVTQAYREARAVASALEELKADEATQQQRADELREAIEAIERSAPQPGELELVQSELRRLRHQSELSQGVQGAEQVLYSGEGAVIETVGQLQRSLDRLVGLDDALGSVASTMGSVAAELDEVARALTRYQGRLDHEPGRLDELEDRLQVLKGLTRRYGTDVGEVLAAKERMVLELENLNSRESQVAELEVRLAKQRAELAERAQKLTEGRQKVCRPLADAIQSELSELSMEKTRLEARLTTLSPCGAKGAEGAELLISPNPGEPLRPLRKIASGGEMSRLLLAMKNVLADRSATSTYIFDEIDTGIGGAVAEVLGAKLRSVASSNQVIAVTHLPQVAAFADAHFQVEKAFMGRRTVTAVTPSCASPASGRVGPDARGAQDHPGNPQLGPGDAQSSDWLSQFGDRGSRCGAIRSAG